MLNELVVKCNYLLLLFYCNFILVLASYVLHTDHVINSLYVNLNACRTNLLIFNFHVSFTACYSQILYNFVKIVINVFF